MYEVGSQLDNKKNPNSHLLIRDRRIQNGRLRAGEPEDPGQKSKAWKLTSESSL